MATTKVVTGDLATALVPDKSVPWAVVLPPKHAEAVGPFPLILSLHGGGLSRDSLVLNQKLGEHDRRIQQGHMPVVIATISSGNSFYADRFDGSAQWETFLITEFLPFVEKTYNCGGVRGRRYLTGASMGGHGSLKLAFRRPEIFAAVAALEPAVSAALDAKDITERDFLWAMSAGGAMTPAGGGSGTLKGVWGPGDVPPEYDAAHYRKHNPCALALDNAAAIRASGLKVYIEAADHDLFNLHDGAEFLHRVLWEQRIEHEYHLNHNADHVGATMVPRSLELQNWLDKIIKETINPPPPRAPNLEAEEQEFMEWFTGGGPQRGEAPVGKPIDFLSDKMITGVRTIIPAEAQRRLEWADPTNGPESIAGRPWRSKL